MTRFTRPDQVSEALGIAFSEQQLAAIAAPLEPGVIIAGAGSGKTTVMAARVVWLVGAGLVRPAEVLGLTFTRKAAAELSARVRGALLRSGVVDAAGVDDAGEQVVMTYDAFAARLVDDHGLRIGVEGGRRVITGAARWRLAARVVAQAAGPFAALSRLRPDSVTERVLELDASLASHLVGSDAIRAHTDEFLRDVDLAPTWRGNRYASLRDAAAAALERVEVAELADAYAAAKASAAAVEFADQMADAARLASAAPEVSAALRAEFAVVLLDEYQDTSSAQAQLLAALFSGADPATGRGHPVTAVGDPFQAIYGWRGAAASNITRFAEAFPRADGRPAAAFALTVNRRSGPIILDAANELSTPLRADRELAWDGVDIDLVAPPGTPPGDITVASFDTWPGEVAWVSDHVVAVHDEGVARRWSDIAVLTRRNEHIGRLYAELRDRGVPVEIVGLGGLLDVPEVADVVAVLRVLADVTANPALVRVLTGPRWAIGPADLAVLGRRAARLAGVTRAESGEFADAVRASLARGEPSAAVSLAEALDDLGDGPYTPEGRERLVACAAELRALRRHGGEPVTDVVRRVVATLGLEVELALRGPDGGRQLAAFVAAVSDYTDVDGDGSLTGLLGYLDAEREHGVGLERAVVSDADSVKLLTIHKAKGLEWEVVVLPALADKVFPSDRASGNWLASGGSGVLPAPFRGDAESIPQLAEVSDAAAKAYREELRQEARRGDDRLAYVAATRAKQHLVATTHAWYPTLGRPRTPSPYWQVLARHGTVAVAEDVSAVSPFEGAALVRPWPQPPDPDVFAARASAAAAVERARADVAHGETVPDAVATLDEAALLATWDAASDTLLAEARAARRGAAVGLPRYLSTTHLLALHRDPQAFARELARPMPKAPQDATRSGVEFHAWLERRFNGAPVLLGDDDEPTASEPVDALIAAFEAGPWAHRAPSAVEVPFALVLGARVVRGRIDAVYTDRGRVEVVDWKTGRAQRSDPLQLAVYRLAWAEIAGLDPADVDVAFVDVASGATIRPAVPGRAEVEQLVAGLPDAWLA